MIILLLQGIIRPRPSDPVGLGINENTLNNVINNGLPFMMSGCSTKKMENACNRPFSDSTPYQGYVGELRNFSFPPDEKDVRIIKK